MITQWIGSYEQHDFTTLQRARTPTHAACNHNARTRTHKHARTRTHTHSHTTHTRTYTQHIHVRTHNTHTYVHTQLRHRQDAGARSTHLDKRSESYSAPSPQKWSASTEEWTLLWLDQQDLLPVTPSLRKSKSHHSHVAHITSRLSAAPDGENRSSEIQGTALGKRLRAWTYIYIGPCLRV